MCLLCFWLNSIPFFMTINNTLSKSTKVVNQTQKSSRQLPSAPHQAPFVGGYKWKRFNKFYLIESFLFVTVCLCKRQQMAFAGVEFRSWAKLLSPTSHRAQWDCVCNMKKSIKFTWMDFFIYRRSALPKAGPLHLQERRSGDERSYSPRPRWCGFIIRDNPMMRIYFVCSAIASGAIRAKTNPSRLRYCILFIFSFVLIQIEERDSANSYEKY